MNILMTGSSGLIGSALVASLKAEGHKITRLLSPGSSGGGPDTHRWDPMSGGVDAIELEGHDAVVHLAGENIAKGRWTASKKRAIQDSRVLGTKGLCDALAKHLNPAKILISASAIGIYGNRGDETLTERSDLGTGFLAETAKLWEAAVEPARKKGMRIVHLRFGVVLSPKGGALKAMLLPFKMGLGGMVGDGKQYMSWVALDDAVEVIKKALEDEIYSGPYNVVSPNPVTNADFTKTLGKVLGRPTFAKMPGFGAKVLFGEMGDALLLGSQRVIPKRLKECWYEFKYPDLEPALRHLLGKPETGS